MAIKIKTSQEKGYDFEKRFGPILGLKITRGSGNQWTAKGDLAGQGMRGELKHTDKQSFSITKELIRKLMRGLSGDEEPFWAIDLDGEVLIVQRAEDWVASRKKPATAAFINPSKSDIKRATSRVPSLLRQTQDEE